MTQPCGTLHYVAPEVLEGKYDRMCDMWSCGVLMFILLCGYPPFFGNTDEEVLSKVWIGKFTFHPAGWKDTPTIDEAKSLICYLLQMNPKGRPTPEQCLNHVWVEEKGLFLPLSKRAL